MLTEVFNLPLVKSVRLKADAIIYQAPYDRTRL